jgi:hypothetical protein
MKKLNGVIAFVLISISFIFILLGQNCSRSENKGSSSVSSLQVNEQINSQVGMLQAYWIPYTPIILLISPE